MRATFSPTTSFTRAGNRQVFRPPISARLMSFCPSSQPRSRIPSGGDEVGLVGCGPMIFRRRVWQIAVRSRHFPRRLPSPGGGAARSTAPVPSEERTSVYSLALPLN